MGYSLISLIKKPDGKALGTLTQSGWRAHQALGCLTEEGLDLANQIE
jgi:hypothetical protein